MIWQACVGTIEPTVYLSLWSPFHCVHFLVLAGASDRLTHLFYSLEITIWFVPSLIENAVAVSVVGVVRFLCYLHTSHGSYIVQ